MQTAASPWNVPVAPPPTTLAAAPGTHPRSPTLQEIMDEELARQLYEDEMRAIEALLSPSSAGGAENIFSDLEEKHSPRELLSADAFDVEEEDDDPFPRPAAAFAAPAAAPPSAPSAKSKQRYDRSVPVEGTDHGLNSIRESFRRWGKNLRHGLAGGRVEAAKFATQDAVLDERTTLLLQKMINRGDLDEVYGCMQSGKEANVYFAVGTDSETCRKRECAVKIFKTALNAFANRKDYINGDRRFDLAFHKKDRRRQMQEWSEKEFRNLARAVKWIRAPEPLHVKEHVVVMSFIGDASEGLPAPTLKEVAASMTASQRIHAYADLLSATRVLLHNAKLVHGDLSEYNVLYHKQKCWLIDFGQAMDQTHPEFLEYLRRDLANLRRFFERLGLPDASEELEIETGLAGILTTEQALEWVTATSDSDAAQVLAKYPKLKAILRAKK